MIGQKKMKEKEEHVARAKTDLGAKSFNPYISTLT